MDGRLLTQHDYELLAEFRAMLAQFLAFSAAAAQSAGLMPRQHQALLAIKGFSTREPITVGELAERLCIRHHSAVELVDRLAQAGLVERLHDPSDRRRVRLRLTDAAEQHLAELSTIHLDELRRLRPALLQILERTSDEPSAGRG